MQMYRLAVPACLCCYETDGAQPCQVINSLRFLLYKAGVQSFWGPQKFDEKRDVTHTGPKGE